MNWVDIVFYLIIYSFLGWCCECIYCSIGEKRIINRGFLTGPFCPVYGFGGLALIYATDFLPNQVIAIFIGGMIVTSLLEYVTSFGMEKLFHTKWWDYSEHKFNIKGRVCLLNSTLFGILCVILHFDIHPVVKEVIVPLNEELKLGFLLAFAIYFTVDFSTSVYSALGIKIKLDGLNKIREDLEAKYSELDSKLEIETFREKLESLKTEDELAENFLKKIESISFFQKRLMNAFPHLKHKSFFK